MRIDLLHNKIVSDNITSGFTDSFNSVLIPKLKEKYGASLLCVQMYEDHLNDGFIDGNSFFYPLTVVSDSEIKREWISWSVEDKKLFSGGIPFAYVGDKPLDFSLVQSVPYEFEERLLGRAMYFEGGTVTLKIETPATDKTFLVGKYSQTFIDEMTRRISEEIERAFSVKGIADSGIELLLVFAPDTYMEHVVDNVTYRRLLMSARGCSARDFWIKWTRNNGAVALTVSDDVSKDDVTFEIGDDVPQKIREKEYRFLVHTSADKYQAAMGRKNITEWRDVVKRVIKRGELIKCEVAASDPVKNGELSFKLREVLTGYTVNEKPAAERSAPESDKNEDLSALLKNVLNMNDGGNAEEDEPVSDGTVQAEDEEVLPPLPEETEASVSDYAEEVEEAEAVEAEPEAADETEEAYTSEPRELADKPRESGASCTEEELNRLREEKLRREIEAEIREKIELEARVKAETEAAYLRRAHDELKAENERLAEIARKAEEERRTAEAERAAEAERLRREIEALERAEAREKERIAEAARLAVLENKRLEEERAEEERRRNAEEERIRAERARLEEEARAAEARRLEEERIRAEAAARAEEAARKKAEEDARCAAELAARLARQAEDEEREKARIEEAAMAARASIAKEEQPNYTYVSKNARLLFRQPVDPNITKRIHEIILTTVKYFHKENVYIKIKATVPDATTVNLHFEKIPQEESELLRDIIQVLGKSGLGIVKVFLE